MLCEGALRVFDKRYTGSSESFRVKNRRKPSDCSRTRTATTAQPAFRRVRAESPPRSIWRRSITCRSPALLADIVAASGGEYQINDNAELDFVPSLGSDQSGTIELIFQRDGKPGSDLNKIEVAEDGEPEEKLNERLRFTLGEAGVFSPSGISTRRMLPLGHTARPARLGMGPRELRTPDRGYRIKDRCCESLGRGALPIGRVGEKRMAGQPSNDCRCEFSLGADVIPTSSHVRRS